MPEATASMQRDLGAGRPSELDDQTGAVVRLAREAGVPVPIHAILYAALAPQESVHRLGGAVLVTREIAVARHWSSALVYGANVSPGDHWSNSVLLESSFDVNDKNAVFGRVEFVQKSAADLALPRAFGAHYDVGELSLGYFRTVRSTRSLAIGVGVRGTVNVVPPSLRAVYESRLPVGAVLYFGIRPGRIAPHGGTMP